MYDQTVIDALATLRTHAAGNRRGPVGTEAQAMSRLVDALDNAGVFHEVDEQTGYDVDGGRPATHRAPVEPSEFSERDHSQLDAHDRAAEARLARRAFGLKD